MTRARSLLFSLPVVAAAAWSPKASAAAPQLVKGPYLTGLSQDAVDVRFELDGAAPATVDVSSEGEAGVPRAVQDASASMHVVHVGGLEPGQAYAYEVRIGPGAGGSVAKGHFVTAPKVDSSAPARFLVYGDDRSDETAHEALVRVLMATPSDFLVNTGDIVADGGSAADWQSFFRVEQPLLRDHALFLSIGNHELYDDQAGGTFARYFGFSDASGTPQPYGTMRWGDVRLFFLNGMHDWQTGAERQWLERELTHADTEPGLVWRVVVVHHGPWSSGPHGGNPKLVDAHVPQLLKAHGVDLVVSGHDHIYERGAATLKYVVSGGGGAPLYPIEHHLSESRKAESSYHFVEIATTPGALQLVAHRIDGTIIERCGFEKGKAWDCDTPPPQPAGAATAPVSTPRPTESSNAGRCGCALPGADARTAGLAAGLLGLAAAAALAVRRRRG